MKTYKIVDSLTYVTYPIYQEIIEIKGAVSNTISSLRNILISAIISTLFSSTPICKYILERINESSTCDIIKIITGYKGTPIFLAIALALCVYTIIKLIEFINSRWRSNKNTKEKQDRIIKDFYFLALPNSVIIKSKLEKIKETVDMDKDKKLLFLMQAKIAFVDLYNDVTRMHIVEYADPEKQVLTHDSEELLNRISKCAYTTFLVDLMNSLYDIISQLHDGYSVPAKKDIDDLYSYFFMNGIFAQLEVTKDELLKKQKAIKKCINSSSQN